MNCGIARYMRSMNENNYILVYCDVYKCALPCLLIINHTHELIIMTYFACLILDFRT